MIRTRAHALAALLALVASAARACQPVQVHAGSSTFVGESCDSFMQFLGIPFAQPPVGPLRFQPPRTSTLTQQLQRMSPVCMQHSPDDSWAREMSEDCLYLNVYVPVSHAVANAPLPVLFFIYGGGFTQGGSSHPMYNASRLCSNAHAIVVTSNYRLGAFGFFTDGDLDLPGNTGLLDQRAALLWVSTNIAAFGGDAGRVTVFGQSAGGISTAYHLTAPASSQLFHAAIIQSNPFHAFFRSPQENKAFTRSFLKHLGCPDSLSPSNMSCLTAPSAASVLAAQLADHAPPLPLSLSEMVLSWQPVIDGVVVTNQTLDLLALGQIHTDIPVVIGTVRDELVSFVWGAVRFPLPSAAYHELLKVVFGHAFAQRLIEMYPGDARDARPSAADLLRDALFRCPTLLAASYITKTGAATWLYAHALLHSPPPRIHISLCRYRYVHVQQVDPVNNSSECAGRAACHGAELVFEWDNALAYNISFTPEEQRLVESLTSVVRQFAAQGSISWPRFDPQSIAFTLVQVSVTLHRLSLISLLCARFSALHSPSGIRPPSPSPRSTKVPQSVLYGPPRLPGKQRTVCCSTYFMLPTFESAGPCVFPVACASDQCSKAHFRQLFYSGANRQQTLSPIFSLSHWIVPENVFRSV